MERSRPHPGTPNSTRSKQLARWPHQSCQEGAGSLLLGTMPMGAVRGVSALCSLEDPRQLSFDMGAHVAQACPKLSK